MTIDRTTTLRERIELPIEGMSCASCAARIERSLNELDGVDADVNYATERAVVRFDPDRVSARSLVETVERTGYHAALTPADVAASDLGPERRRLIACAVLAIPVVALSMIPPLQFDGWQWLALALATPVATWGAWPFHRSALASLRHGAATMDTLVSMGTLAAFGWSLVALLVLGAGDPGMRMDLSQALGRGSVSDALYLEVAAALPVYILAGRYCELRARRRASSAIESLLALGAKDVALLDDGGVERRIPVGALEAGMRFVVRPGERIAADGVVEDGWAAVDRALLTGESVPVDVSEGDEVAGGTLAASGRLVVRATRVGQETALAQIARLVAEAQSGKAPVQRLADRISAVFVPAVIVLAVATLAGWLATGADPSAAFGAAVAVLVVACPCALGLATPMAILVGTTRGAQLGLLIRGPEALEATRRVDTVVLDKTGTVTTGELRLVDVATDGALAKDEVLRLAGALEDASEHPAGRAIARAAHDGGAPLPAVGRFASLPGLGVEGTVDGLVLLAGRPSLLAARGIELPASLADARREAEAQGRSVVALAADGEAVALLVLADAPKATSAEAVRRLRALGLHPVLLTGDTAATANAVAGAVGIDDVVAGVLPDGKVAEIERLQCEGRVVAMVGDGVNDAPALAQADLGIALGTGADVAIEASDLTIVSGDLRAAADAIRLSCRTVATIRGNLVWAFAYNVAALPLAAAGIVSPLLAGAAMAASSLFVVSNSLRLRRFRAIR
jgi:Cu+-exporting ATPase